MTNVYACWEAQKGALRAALEGQADLSAAVYEVRRTLSQVEQDAMAGMTDGVLRQQAGVLLNQLKASAELLACLAESRVWQVKRQAERPARRGRALWAAAAAMQLALAGYCYLKGLPLGWLAALGALAAAIAALAVSRRRASTDDEDELRVTIAPDADRLLEALDGLLRSVDRSLADLSCLNDQLRAAPESAGEAALAHAADLMEALCDAEGEAGQAAMDAARRLLSGMGLSALDYSEENRRFFNALPSKTETRTLSPAIVSVRDQRLLRRGTAAVRTDAA